MQKQDTKTTTADATLVRSNSHSKHKSTYNVR